MTNSQTAERRGNEMIITRTFVAACELIFEVHSDCKHLMNWWGGRERLNEYLVRFKDIMH